MSPARTFNPPCGPITAHSINNLTYAKGIPYANATRFQKPQPVIPWTSNFDASKPAPACPQIKDKLGEALLRQPLLRGLEISEDCLRLSITLPSGPDEDVSNDKKLPVMVFIHGGAYVTGAGDAPLYDASSIVREQGIIVVMVTYRLGLLGYIGDGSAERPANLGLLDQIAALRWVQTNIETFGGDAANVTVAGQSAGADAVVHLMATDDAPTLFKRAIIQSAPLGIRGGRLKMSGFLFELAKDLTPETPVQEVIDRTEKSLVAVRKFGLVAGMCLATQYGFDPLPAEDKLDEMWARNAKKIDVLIGTTREEISMFSDAIPGLNMVFSIPAVGGWLQTNLTSYFTRKVYGDETKRVAQLLGNNGKTWLYDFYWYVKGSRYKSSHAIELIMEFGEKEVSSGSKFADGGDWEVIDEYGRRFRQMWASFIKGEELQDQGEVEGVLKYTRVMPKV